MNQPIHNAYWLSRFDSLLDSALAQHRAVSLIRVDLRFPEYMPVTIMDPDPDSAVISRFFASLKAKIQAYQRKKRCANQRVHATSLGYRTASGAVFLSEPADVLFPVHLLRSFLRHVPVQSAGRPPSLQPDSVAGLSDGAGFPVLQCE